MAPGWCGIQSPMLLDHCPISLCKLFFSHSVVSNSLQPHELQHARLPCPSLSPGVYSNSCPAIFSSVVPFSSCPQSFPASESFPMSRLFPSGGQSIGAPALASVFPINIEGLISFRIDWFDLLAVQGTLKGLLRHHSSKASIVRLSPFFMVQLSQPHMTTGKTIALTIWIFVSKVMSLLFNMLSQFIIAFFPRSKHLLISWLQSLFIVNLEPREVNSVIVSTFPPSMCHKVMGQDAMMLVF